jgi:hypothetical protein
MTIYQLYRLGIQADMGSSLYYVFFVNMLGALILHPTFACFLYLKGDKMM